MESNDKKEHISATFELKALAIAVEELLELQKRFFKSRDGNLLRRCKEMEAELLKRCDCIIRPNSQTKLF